MRSQFDHEKLVVYQVAIEFVTVAFRIAEKCQGPHRHARDQLLRASQSIPLNIAEGNGKWSARDRGRFFEIARGSATESAAILDVLVTCKAISIEESSAGKTLLIRIVSMLTKLIAPRTTMAREERPDYEESRKYDEEV